MNQKKHPIGRFFAVLGITLLCLLISLLGVIWVLERGPSPTVTGMFTRSVRETSAIRWISNIFLTEEELNEYKSVSTEDLETESVNTSLIHIEKAAEKRESGSDQTESVKLIDIAEGTCKGKLLIVSDPKQVILGTSDEFVKQPGLQLTDMVAKYDGLAGINAGGFNDENGTGSGGIPQGIVIVNGKVIFGNDLTPYHLVGLDRDGILHVGSMNGREAVENGIQWAGRGQSPYGIGPAGRRSAASAGSGRPQHQHAGRDDGRCGQHHAGIRRRKRGQSGRRLLVGHGL